MKFVTFKRQGEEKIGLLIHHDQVILDLKTAEIAMSGQNLIPNTMIEGIELGEEFLERCKEIYDWSSKKDNREWTYSLESNEIQLLSPIPKPRKNIFCIGKNYVAHALEIGKAEDIPEYPMVFTKAPTTVTGHLANVYSHHSITQKLDYEGELAVVIGKKGISIPKEKAMDYVFGYTIVNDITARDIQQRHKQYFLGKSLDTTCPIGPSIVHKSLITNPHHLQITTKVNGEVRQNGNTKDFIFDIPTLISVLSQGMTLEPGDIISTGTPAGVGHGMNPPKYLKAGDVIEVEIEGIGVLKNRIVN
ncbi:fumarylacetoacetate hydrolase family protein [Tepidibacillus sp. LV47]|uniref:fumarylacetoacetate hydrolase family protein n=1 Tax=Tepidibacillus sp. LV47 TaxID=3398228 RepID=UPI003AAB3AEC